MELLEGLRVDLTECRLVNSALQASIAELRTQIAAARVVELTKERDQARIEAENLFVTLQKFKEKTKGVVNFVDLPELPWKTGEK